MEKRWKHNWNKGSFITFNFLAGIDQTQAEKKTLKAFFMLKNFITFFAKHGAKIIPKNIYVLKSLFNIIE